MKFYNVITMELWATLPAISNSAESVTLYYFGRSSLSIRCSHSQSQGMILCSYCTNPSSCSSMTSMDSFSSTLVHLVAIFDTTSALMTLYVNSRVQCSASFGYTLPDPTDSNFQFLIGASPSNLNELSFTGSIDEFRIWAGPLPSATITANYENGPTASNIGMSLLILLSSMSSICFCSATTPILVRGWNII